MKCPDWELSVLYCVLILLLYVTLGMCLLHTQLNKGGMQSEHHRLIAVSRMFLNYILVLYTIGTFKSKATQLMAKVLDKGAQIFSGVWHCNV